MTAPELAPQPELTRLEVLRAFKRRFGRPLEGNSSLFPAPPRTDLLLDKIKDVAFQALSQILAQPGFINTFLRRRGTLGRLWARLTGSGLARLRAGVEERDVGVFRQLDFTRFCRHV